MIKVARCRRGRGTDEGSTRRRLAANRLRGEFDDAGSRVRLAFGYDLSHTSLVKTTISIPDEDFDAAEQVAEELGLSRSELYANAVREFVARRRRQDVTDRLDELYGDRAVSSQLDPVLAKLQSLSLPKEDW